MSAGTQLHHVGPKGPGPCAATKGGCPYSKDNPNAAPGEIGSHFNSLEDAQKAYDTAMKQNEVQAPMRKPSRIKGMFAGAALSQGQKQDLSVMNGLASSRKGRLSNSLTNGMRALEANTSATIMSELRFGR